MQEIVVLGGYGRLGRRCVREIADTTGAALAVVGRNAQRAERFAGSVGDRARGAYADALRPSTVERLLEDAAAVVGCIGPDSLFSLEVVVRRRIPFVWTGSAELAGARVRLLGERAWQAQVPIVLHAGTIPGLPGLLAEHLVRRHPELDEIRIASTGPWSGSVAARAALARRRAYAPRPRGWWRRVRFPEPVESRWVRPEHSEDLQGFRAAHTVERITYCEARPRPGPFAIEAVASAPGERGPVDRIALVARDPLHAAAALAGLLVRAALSGRLPAGLSTPREALSPPAALGDLEKRGLRLEF